MTRRSLLLLLGILSFCPRAAAAQCGGEERWSVKVGSDQGASAISLTAPIPTLLHDLIAIHRPQLPSDDVTRVADERLVRTVSGRLVQFKLESGKTGDQDYHLVITDDTLTFSSGGSGTQPISHSFVAEIVNPNCISGRKGDLPTPSHFQSRLEAVRTKFEQQFPNITGGWNQGGGVPVQVTGLVFFDRPHGQTGRALNGLEIHPVTEINFGSAGPAPAATTTTSSLSNPGFETGNAGWTTTASVISSDSREPAHTGNWKAWLCGYGTPHTDRLSQVVSIPSSAHGASFSFFLHISTEEQTLQQFDTLTVRIKDTSGHILQTLKTFSNLQASAGYSLKTFDLSAYKGKTIRIELVGQEDNGSMTSFVVDDFVITIEGAPSQ